MSAAGLLAALAALLAVAATAEALRGGGLELPPLPFGLDSRTARAALRLGLPERLRRAGLEGRLSLRAVLAAKLGGAAGGLGAGFLAAPAAPGRSAVLVAAVMPAAGFFAADAWLERRARRRRRALLAALPDALDLLAVSAGSGRGPAAGLRQVAAAGSGPLAEELRLTVAELSCGVSLSAALASLRARVSGGEVATLVAAIERSRRYGSPLAEQLRRQASALRRDSRRAVEERAARAAPKIQLVVALVLVPSVLLMISAALIANAGTLLSGF
ncbi:MAG TPA: type II secretion system F family protein [Solirubrobacterales bacterium]|nr:type II secretion system F family protein [Solirubrobacterales bacterium]